MEIHDPFLLGFLIGMFAMASGLLLMGWGPTVDDDGNMFSETRRNIDGETIWNSLADLDPAERISIMQSIFGKDFYSHIPR